MNTKRVYWVCQLVGWGGYSVIGMTVTAQDVGWRPSTIGGYLLFTLYSIGLTDMLRREMRRRRWLSGPSVCVVLRLAATAVAIGVIQTLLVTSTDFALRVGRGPFLERPAVLYIWWGTTCATGAWIISYLLLSTKRHHRELEVQYQLAVREAKLRALEAQINPHFLFNCLNSIRALVLEDAARAQDMLTRLANILRYNLRGDLDHTVSLASEVSAVEDYLALEGVRLEERLRVHFAVDPGVSEAPIPPMLLQTLVENAIKHGIACRPAGGDLVVRALRDREAVIVEVENTGQLANAAGMRGLGLANTRERLRLLYGDRAHLELTNRQNERVVATVSLPYSHEGLDR